MAFGTLGSLRGSDGRRRFLQAAQWPVASGSRHASARCRTHAYRLGCATNSAASRSRRRRVTSARSFAACASTCAPTNLLRRHSHKIALRRTPVDTL